MDTLQDVLGRIDAQQATQPTPDALETIQSLVRQGMTSGLGIGQTGAPTFSQPAYNVAAGYAGPLRESDRPSIQAAADIPVYNGSQLSPQTLQAITMAGGPLRGLIPDAQAQRAGQGFMAATASGVPAAVQSEVMKGIAEKYGLTENAYQKAFDTARGKAAGDFAGMMGGTGDAASTSGGNAPAGTLPIDDVASKVANYDIQVPSGMALRTPYWQAVLRRAVSLNPDFDQGKAKAAYNIKQDVAKGTGFGANIVSINTATSHLGELADAVAQLDNSQYRAANFIANQAANQAGGTGITNFNTKADAVASELAKVFKGTGSPTNIEVQEWRKNLSPNASPEQQKAAIDGAISLMRGRVNAIQDRYKKTTGQLPEGGFLSDEAKSVISSLGYDPITLKKTGTKAAAPASQGSGGWSVKVVK